MPTTTTIRCWTDTDLQVFQEGLTAENLAALMRSTWTWDDRALRRDLAGLLTDLAALGDLPTGSDAYRVARGRVLADAGRFVAAVLGPRAVADSGHPMAASFRPVLERLPGLRAQADDRSALVAIAGDAVRAAGATPAFDPADSTQFGGRVLARHALEALGSTPAAIELLQRLESGAVDATVAAAEASGSWDPALVRTRAELVDDQWILDGEKLFVPFADTAQTLLVVARSTAGPSFFAVAADAAGVEVTQLDTMDDTRPLYRLRLQRTPATIVGYEGGGGRTMSRMLDLAAVSLAADQLQAARRCVDLLATTVARTGDGRDGLGDAVVRLVTAQASYDRAVRAQSGDPEEFAVAAAMAHIRISDAFATIAERVAGVLAVEGGVGAEEASRLYIRSQWSELLLGGPALTFERLLERLGI